MRRIYIIEIFFACFFLLGTIPLFSQEPTPASTNIDFNNVSVPESPNAASFEVFGNTPVNTATGVPTISIPLHTIEVDGVSVPISLSYNASGVKVDDLASTVGLGWRLNAGGGLFRSVVSRPDDLADGWFYEGPLPNSHYEDFDVNNDYWQRGMRGYPPEFRTGKARNTDHNPDNFSYSFLNYSNAFIFDIGEGDVVKEQADGLFVDFYTDYTTIYDQNGNKYFFDVIEESRNVNHYASIPQVGMGVNEDLELAPVIKTGWMLSRITTKNNEHIKFDYNSLRLGPYTINDVEHHLTQMNSCNSNAPLINDPGKKNITNIHYDYDVQLIDKIVSTNGKIRIDFQYGIDNQLSHWKTKLEKITITDSLSQNYKAFRFEYEKFGGDPRLKLKKIIEIGNNNEEKLPYIFEYNGTSLPPKGDLGKDFYGYFNNKSSNISLVHRSMELVGAFSENISFVDVNAGYRDLDINAVKMGVLKKIIYPTGGSTEFTFEANGFGNNYCGGLRLKEIMEKDGNESFNRKVYQYDELRGTPIGLNIWLTRKNEGNSKSFYSSIILPANAYKSGYFYGKVTESSYNGTEHYKKEYLYEEDIFFLTKFKYSLTKETLFKNNTPIKIKEFSYQNIGTPKYIEWNVLGDMKCYGPNNYKKLGYGYKIEASYYGNYAKLPISIATTDFLGSNYNKPVTVIKDILYDDDTLLKTQEITNNQKTRHYDPVAEEVTYPVTDIKAEIITTKYKYPITPTDEGFHEDFPIGLLISKEVSSNKNNDKILGQALEYDNIGNVIKTYQYNKGEIGNNSSLSYVDDYEEISNILYENGKPVQMLQKSGEATSYIWGLNNQHPVAKIEGKTRAALDQNILQAVENATYGGLPAALNTLRSSLNNDKAMLTTYTYKPLAGVETITDPKGDYITYHYDEFGRLDYVKDKDGNFLSENEYKYAQ